MLTKEMLKESAARMKESAVMFSIKKTENEKPYKFVVIKTKK